MLNSTGDADRCASPGGMLFRTSFGIWSHPHPSGPSFRCISSLHTGVLYCSESCRIVVDTSLGSQKVSIRSDVHFACFIIAVGCWGRHENRGNHEKGLPRSTLPCGHAVNRQIGGQHADEEKKMKVYARRDAPPRKGGRRWTPPLNGRARWRSAASASGVAVLHAARLHLATASAQTK